jgi:uncharacterized protein YdbL (DUF1318 family)
MKKMKGVLSLAVAMAIGCVCLAQADTVEDAKNRRKERREQVEQLIKAGKAEEGADGYLAAKAGASEEGNTLIKAENADRKIGYEVIAKANGKTVEEVGKQAAAILKALAAKEK